MIGIGLGCPTKHEKHRGGSRVIGLDQAFSENQFWYGVVMIDWALASPASSLKPWQLYLQFVQFTAVQCSVVQCSAVRFSAVQCSAVQCSGGAWDVRLCALVTSNQPLTFPEPQSLLSSHKWSWTGQETGKVLGCSSGSNKGSLRNRWEKLGILALTPPPRNMDG